MPQSMKALTAILVAGLSGCQAGGDQSLLARAAGHELSVNEAVSILAGAVQLPNEPGVAQALGELWVDYTLIAEAALGDSTLSSIDVAPLVLPEVEERLILTLADSVAIRVDTVISDDDLRARFRAEAPGIEIQARHILLGLPNQATDAQIDSVRADLAALRDRIVAGEDFSELARQYSQDTGNNQDGGNLGTFGRGEFARPLDEAAFALEVGELSDIVRSPFGFHIIRVDARDEPSFEEIQDQYRTQVQAEIISAAQTVFVDSLIAEAEIEPVDDAGPLAKQMASDPGTRLSGRAADRPVIRYRGGDLSLAEVLDYMQKANPQYLQQVVDAPDEVVTEQVLIPLVQRELLLENARSRQLSIPETVVDSLNQAARENFASVARFLNLLDIQPAPEQSEAEAVAARVGAVIGEVVAGTRQAVPIAGLAYTLRRQFDHEVLSTGIAMTVQRVGEARGSTPLPPPAPTPPATPTPEPTQPDTSGSG